MQHDRAAWKGPGNHATQDAACGRLLGLFQVQNGRSLGKGFADPSFDGYSTLVSLTFILDDCIIGEAGREGTTVVVVHVGDKTGEQRGEFDGHKV